MIDRRLSTRSGPRLRLILTVAAVVILAPGHLALSKRPPRPLRQDGRWLVAGAPLLAGGGGPEFVTLENAGGVRRLGISSGCAPAKATVKATKKGTRVSARWKQCGGAKRVQLSGSLDTTCGTFTGTLTAKGSKRRVVRATRSACGDGARDARGEEEWEARADCDAGFGCESCRCVLDAAFAPENAYGGAGDPLPADAISVAPEEFLARVAEGGAYVVKSEVERLAAERAAELAADKQLVDELIAQNPELAHHVQFEVDPTARPLGNGNVEIDVPTLDGPQPVVLFGPDYAYRALANGIRETPKRANQERVYATLYETLPEDQRAPWPDPGALGSQTDDQVRQLVTDLATRVTELLPNVGVEEPSGAPVRRAAGRPRASACGHVSSAIYQRYTWPLKNYTTPVRSQGNRGTCVAHGIVGGLEAYLWKAHGIADKNLSEQELYALAKGRWFPVTNDYEEGLSTDDTMEEMDERNTRVHLDPAWSYNPSWSRDEIEDDEYYVNSCMNYGETCSDTNHQMETYCTVIFGKTHCLRQTEVEHDGSAGSEYYTLNSFTPIWNGFEPENSLGVLRAMLSAGKPVVLSLAIDSAFRNSSAADPYLVSDGGPTVGGHAVLATGWISNLTLVQKVPGAPLGDGGGYVIIKNSWGCGWGDGGYVYASFAWIIEHMKEVHAIMGSGSGGTLPSIHLVASNYNVTGAGQVTLTANGQNLVKVEFYEGFTKIDEDTSAPFTTIRNFFGSENATHYYFARGYDAVSNVVDSDVIQVRVNFDVTPPYNSTLFVNGVTQDATVMTPPGTVNFSITASDNVGIAKVSFYRKSKFALPWLIGEDFSPPYAFTLNYGLGDVGTYRYYAVATDTSGKIKSSDVRTVTVVPGVEPLISTFSVTPTSLPTGGGQVTLNWAVLGATSLSINQGVGTVAGPTGSTTRNVTQTTTFTLTATNGQGTSTALATVNVNPGLKPFIQSFTATPDALGAPGAVTLPWEVVGEDTLSIDQGVGDVTGLDQKVVQVDATTTFTLSATNGSGTSTKTVTVPLTPTPTTTSTSLAPTTSTSTSTSVTTTTSTSTTVPGVPDLRSTAVGIDANPVDPGQQVTISWTIANQGGAAATAPWVDGLWLSTVQAPGGTFVGDQPRATNLAAGASYDGSITFTIPNLPAGTYYLVILTDRQNQVYEGNAEGDAQLVSAPITVTP